MPNPLFKAKAIAYDGAIYLINGVSSGNFVNSCFRYSPETNNWNQLANTPFAGDGRKLVVYQDRIWAIGGFNSANSAPVSSVDSFDPRTNSWRAEASLTTSRNWPVAWVGNGGIYVGGGDNGAPLNTVEFYDPATKNWISNGTLPYALWWGGSIQSDGFAYLMAGSGANDVFFDKVYSADLTSPMDLYYRENSAAGSAYPWEAECGCGWQIKPIEDCFLSRWDGDFSGL